MKKQKINKNYEQEEIEKKANEIIAKYNNLLNNTKTPKNASIPIERIEENLRLIGDMNWELAQIKYPYQVQMPSSELIKMFYWTVKALKDLREKNERHTSKNK